MAGYVARVVQHRTMDFTVEADTPEEASDLAEELAASSNDWSFAEPVYQCVSLHEEEKR